MGKPATIHLTRTVTRGDTWPGITFTVTKTGFNFAGATARCQLRSDTDAGVLAAPTVSLNTGTVGTLTGALSLSAAATAELPPGAVYGDVEITHGGLGTQTVFTFQLNVDPDVTQPA